MSRAGLCGGHDDQIVDVYVFRQCCYVVGYFSDIFGKKWFEAIIDLGGALFISFEPYQGKLGINGQGNLSPYGIFHSKSTGKLSIEPFLHLRGLDILCQPEGEPFASVANPTGTAVSGSIAVATVGLSLVGRSLWDRFFSTRDPCGQSLKQLEKQDAEKG